MAPVGALLQQVYSHNQLNPNFSKESLRYFADNVTPLKALGKFFCSTHNLIVQIQ